MHQGPQSRSAQRFLKETVASRAKDVNAIWTLHGAYVFGCTAMADEQGDAPRLRRTLDWPLQGIRTDQLLPTR